MKPEEPESLGGSAFLFEFESSREPDPNPASHTSLASASTEALRLFVAYGHPLDPIRLPVDAGEHAAGLLRILQRVLEGYGRSIRCAPGWYGLICRLDQTLASIDPSYEIRAVKQVDGQLRFQYKPGKSLTAGDRTRMKEAVRSAVAESLATCEICGHPGQPTAALTSTRTLCAACSSLP
jgi:hypothetical protein